MSRVRTGPGLVALFAAPVFAAVLFAGAGCGAGGATPAAAARWATPTASTSARPWRVRRP